MSISFGFLSTYPPTKCGIARFSSELMRHLATPESGDRAGVVRVVDFPVTSPASEVVGHLQTHAHGSHRAAADALNEFDVVIVQHRFDAYGGPDGDQILPLLDLLRRPTVTVAQSIPACPTAHQRDVLTRIIRRSDAVVALTAAARARLVVVYAADPARVTVIPHGAPSRRAAVPARPGERQLVLTWGELGPGKGIEWAIDSIQQLRRMHPSPAYIVAGRTDPRVVREQGESYRLRLRERARSAGVAHLVRFAGSYLDETMLAQLLRRADVVLLPYDSRDQVSSGVLVEAVAAGRPVIATMFPHAVELLESGAGMLVPQFDSAAIGSALHDVLTDPELAEQMSSAAARLAPQFAWPSVAGEYRALATSLLESHRRDPSIIAT
jgi:glycosyltransferase involved in cell wall biosynthesis